MLENNGRLMLLTSNLLHNAIFDLQATRELR